jgi:S1-C subfamily serine protease
VLAAAATGALRSGSALEPDAPAPIDETLRHVIARVAPGVVRIEVDGTRPVARPEKRFFRDLAAEPREGGAGIVLRADGLILTHATLVAYDLTRIEVLTGTGRRLVAELVARDPDLEVALLKADVGKEPLVPLELGTTIGLEPGRLVLTFGNPFGVARDSRASASLGVVTALGPLDAREVLYAGPIVATDAALNPGNEGGPLVDLDGRVLGVLAPLVRDRRAGSMVGYAIPIDAIAPRLEALARGGAPARIGLLVDAGPPLSVARVVPEGPADKAGVAEGDTLLELDGTVLALKDDLRRVLATKRPGAKVKLKVARKGVTLVLDLELGEGE